jgi:hypothetical protein
MGSVEGPENRYPDAKSGAPSHWRKTRKKRCAGWTAISVR